MKAIFGLNRARSFSPSTRRGSLWRALTFALLALTMISCAGDRSLREEEEMRNLSLLNYDEGMRHKLEGNDLLALDYFERSVLMSPRAAAYYEIGQIHERLGEYGAAADSYRAALENAPDHQKAKFALLAVEHRPQPDLTAQMEQRQAIIEQRNQKRLAEASQDRVPTLGEVRSLIFPGLEAEADLPSATDPVYEPTRQMVLGTYAYHLENGKRFEGQGNWERAADEYRVALKASPNELEARLNLGDMMLRLERHARAYNHYTEAIRLFPGSPEPLLKMGNYYDSLDRADLARDFYSQALFMDPDYSEALNNLAAIEIRNQNFDEAVALLELAVQARPEYPLPYLNLGIARENAGDRPAALQAYQQYVELGGERAEEVNVWIAEMQAGTP